MQRPSQGAAALRAYLYKKRITHLAFARAEGVHVRSVDNWVNGFCKPKAEILSRFAAELNIPIRWWYEPAPAQKASAE